jgi:SAM-dependent methyltransferase
MLSNEHYTNLHRSHLDDRELRILNAFKCLKAVRAHVPFRSVVDFGCGIGGWLVAAKQLGAIKVTGLEGDWIKDRETLLEAHEIVVGNLASEKFDFNRSFDLGISIEVAEHLPESSADVFCDNLALSSNLLVFSAAIPVQGGINHLNEQRPRYWVDKFWDRGFVPLEMIRPVIANEPKMYPWLQQNIMMFMNYDLLHFYCDLAKFALPRRHFYSKYWPM